MAGTISFLLTRDSVPYNTITMQKTSLLKWWIRNHLGHYVVVDLKEPGTVMLTNDPAMATIFGPHTRDYMDGYAAGLTAALDGKFKPVSSVHIQKPVHEKMDDIHAGK